MLVDGWWVVGGLGMMPPPCGPAYTRASTCLVHCVAFCIAVVSPTYVACFLSLLVRARIRFFSCCLSSGELGAPVRQAPRLEGRAQRPFPRVAPVAAPVAHPEQDPLRQAAGTARVLPCGEGGAWRSSGSVDWTAAQIVPFCSVLFCFGSGWERQK